VWAAGSGDEAGGRAVPESYPGQQRAAPGEKQLVTNKREDAAPLGFVLRGIYNRHPYLHARGIHAGDGG